MASDIQSSRLRATVFNNMVSPYTNKLYNELSDRGIDLTVVSCVDKEPNRDWGAIGQTSYRHVVLDGLHFKVGSGRFAHLNRGIGRALEATKPDVLVINGFYPSMVVAAFWAWRHKIPLALTIDGWAQTMPDTLYHRIVRPRVLALCRNVFVCGLKGRDYFLASGFDDRNIFLVPLTPAWPAPSSRPRFEDRPFHLTWVAHLNNEVKNAGFFLEVARRLKASIPDLKLRIVGNGTARQSFIDALDKDSLEYAYSSQLNWPDMPGVFQSSRLLLLPSLWEPWGLVCNEAMQCGVPCIVSPHVGAGADLVLDGVNGVVAPLDADDWAHQIRSLIQDPETWTRLSNQARLDATARSVEQSASSFIQGLKATKAAPERRRPRNSNVRQALR